VFGQPFDLSGRVAVVTGAASGIGRASAGVLARAGAAVVLADLDRAGLEETASSIAAAGGAAEAVVADVSRRADVEALVAEAVATHGRLDVMCNIAGIIQTSEVIDTSEEDLDRVLAVNLKGVFFGAQAAARQMVAQGSGSIVNMSSGAIDTPAPGLVCYAMAKAAVAQLTKTLAVEVGRKGVRVNAIAPGFVVTGMTSRHFVRPDGTVDEKARQALLEMMASRAALGRVGEPNDVAYAVLYLASDASSFVTGQVLRPNGGVGMP
jgi:3-oxoacyl-[acyl-carrier protein] reductase